MTEPLSEASLPILPSSPGAILRQARENAGMHLSVLSVNLKVSVKQLQALEADQFDQLSEPVFARALAAKVCRILKIDSEPVLAMMPLMSNGLKPLNLIESPPKTLFNLHQLNQISTAFLSGGKLWIVLVLGGLLLWAFSADMHREIPMLNTKPDVAEVVPTMPPVQEQVAPDTAPSDLPKALVFDSSTPSADANRRPNPTDSNPATPEVKK